MYKNYVKDIKLEGFGKLVIIPLIITLITYLLPQLIQATLAPMMGVPATAVGSVPSNMGMIIMFAIMPFVMIKVSKLSLRNLGIKKERAFKNIVVGSIAGIVLLTAVALVIYALGGIRIEKNSFAITVGLIGGLEFFILQGTWEELMYRAYLMPLFSKKFGDVASIIITSILFTVGHALNPNMQVLPVINLFLASIVFSVIYYYTGNLLLIGLGHGLWNFSQGFIFGAQVSGNTMPASLLKSIAIEGKNLISGGTFGFEGGIITTIFAIVLTIIFVNLIKKNGQQEF